MIYFSLRNSSIIESFLQLNGLLAIESWNLFGNSGDVEGVQVMSNHFSFRVTAECTSIGPTAIFASAVTAWPSSITEKLWGIIAGTLALFIINQIRMLTLFFVGTHFPDYLDFAHYYLWQGLIVLLALGLWLFWIDKVTNSMPAVTSDVEGTAM